MREVATTVNSCELQFRTPESIDVARARRQQQSYRSVLQSLQIEVDFLPADEGHPDCCFVEDTAVLLGDVAVLCRPGAISRRGEVGTMKDYFQNQGYRLIEMTAPAELDGGDVLQIGTDLFIGLSHRTNQAGFDYLAAVARDQRRTAHPIEVRGALHLKTACTSPGDGLLICQMNALGNGSEFLQRFRVVPPFPGEDEGTNVCPVNDRVLVPAHCHRTLEFLSQQGFQVIPVDISEFHKAEAGLTCLSILGTC